AAGTVFVLLIGRWLLPERKGAESAANHFRLDDYFTELTVLEDSPFRGKTVEAVGKTGPYRLEVVGLVRDGRRVPGPLGGRRLEVGDVLLVRTTPEDIVAIRSEAGVELHPIAQYQSGATASRDGTSSGDGGSARLVQAVVAPRSDLAGRTIGTLDFRRRYGVIVLGLWRRAGWLDEEIAQTPLRPGDVLVRQGDDEAHERVAEPQ